MEIISAGAQIIENSVREILRHIGENPSRQGLEDTPARIVRMWKEIFRGYDKSQSPRVTTFQNGADGIIYDEMIVDTGTFYSMCEHHMMPFFGTYYFAYIPHPQGRILGLSKIARVVDYHCARLQVQERLVSDIIRHIEGALFCQYPALGIAVVLKGEHLCKSMRGAKKKGTMTCSSLTGAFKTDNAVRNEFLKLIHGGITYE
jgi:GTP cyclohydrolase I